MTIRLYDTMARAKRDFVPREADRVTMYVCGPTVYGRAHIGNARPAVVFDTLRRLLEHEFPDREVIYARNVTDVDDKIIAAAEADGVGYRQITERYYKNYIEDMGALGVALPTLEPRATAFIPDMIRMIERLIEKGNAYEAAGHVLFNVPSDPDYGTLSRRDRDAMIAGARVEVAPYKRDASDFVLWKPAGESAEQVALSFDSPWGRGRPGWHIECSAMIRAHLGETIDIHGGGLDLVFPHHENELAQSRCAHGKPLANYWVHNGFVDMGAEKMSKSLGNVVTVDQLLGAGHRGEVLRLALLSAHYRSPLPWTESLVAQSKSAFEKWCAILLDEFDTLEEESQFVSAANSPTDDGLKALLDDLNTPQMIAVIHTLARQAANEDRKPVRRKLIMELASNAKLLGLELSSAKTELFEIMHAVVSNDERAAIDAKISERNLAKKERDFATADRIRDALKADGIVLEDGSGGTTWRRA